jgi:hypothetical protein
MALLVTGCGSSSSSDAVSTALQMPGVRTVVVPKQHNNLTVMVPPCSVAAVSQRGASGPPPGSNTVVVPKGTLTQTVAIQPCQASGGQSASGSSGMPPPSSTILLTPGGAQTQQQAQSSASGSSQPGQQNQLVLPANSNIQTLIVPPCTPSSGSGGAGAPQGANNALPSTSKTVTAPPCTFQQQSG